MPNAAGCGGEVSRFRLRTLYTPALLSCCARHPYCAVVDHVRHSPVPRCGTVACCPSRSVNTHCSLSLSYPLPDRRKPGVERCTSAYALTRRFHCAARRCKDAGCCSSRIPRGGTAAATRATVVIRARGRSVRQRAPTPHPLYKI
jgi:hypothetical protein